MDRQEILERVKKIITDTFYVEEIQEEDRLIEDIGMYSLDRVGFFMDLEKEFNITISEEQEEDIITVGELIDYLQTKL